MITCAWCGTTFQHFQSNCENCGASLPRPESHTARISDLPVPPPAPRQVPKGYLSRLLITDAWTIASGVFLLLGIIFGPVGLVLTLAMVTAFVGVPFILLGLLFLVIGLPVLIWRVNRARKTVQVLQTGNTAEGEIIDVAQNYNVEVNHRHPWVVTYSFYAGGFFEGKSSSLRQPPAHLTPGAPVYVLYQRENPETNTLYPPLR